MHRSIRSLVLTLALIPAISFAQNPYKFSLDSIVEYAWDGTKYFIGNTELYTYDSLGRNISAGIKSGNLPDTITEYYLEDLSYDVQDRIIEKLGKNWVDTAMAFHPVLRTNYEFDASGNKTVKMDSVYSQDSLGFIPASIDSMFYNPGDKLIRSVSWAHSGSWEPFSEQTIQYDTIDRISTDVLAYWDFDSIRFINATQTEYYYDTIGRDSARVQSNWDIFGSNWFSNTKTEFSYDSVDQIIKETLYDNVEGWELLGEERFFYDANGRQVLHEEYEFVYDTVYDLRIQFKDSSLYDALGNTVHYYRWENTGPNTPLYMRGQEIYQYDNTADWETEISKPYAFTGEDAELDFAFFSMVNMSYDLEYDTTLFQWDTLYINEVFYTQLLGLDTLCNADFSFETDTTNSYIVHFTDLSDTATAWHWDFGDSSSTSILQNPTQAYSMAGTYDVTLTVFNADSSCQNNIVTKSVTVINDTVDCNADFDFMVDSIDTRLIHFTDLSDSALTWQWDFGDTTFSNLQNPSNWYQDSGTYDVLLTVFDADSSCWNNTVLKSVTVQNQPCETSWFGYDYDFADSSLVYFTDSSSNSIVSWYWVFGDGTSSTLQYPSHQYSSPGTYRVVMSTQDSTGLCNNNIVRNIVVGNPLCNASFDFMTDTSNSDLILTNTSEGSGLKYFWTFGDGEVSKLKDPSHTYAFDGSYKVSLTVRNADGSCNDRYEAVVKAGDVSCDPGFTVFVDSSTQTARFQAVNMNPNNRYYWVIGDGTTMGGPSHDHVFEHPGFYSLSLTVSNSTAGCQETNRETILVGQRASGGKAGFIYLSDEGNTVNFTDQSLGDGLSYFWNFNDGDTSTQKNPEHVYLLAGYYNVCLTVTANGSQDTYCERIFAGEDTRDQCLAAFTFTVDDATRRISCTDRSFGDPDSWLWDYGGSWTTTVQNPTWTASSPRFLKLQQTIRNSSTGCRDDAWGLVNIGAPAQLKVDFGFRVDSTNKKADSYPVDFVGVSVGDGNKLKWNFGDGTVDSTTNSPVHIYSNPGLYKVCLSIQNTTTGDADTSCQMIEVAEDPTTDIFEVDAEGLSLLTYPNPVSDNCVIRYELPGSSNIELSVFDLMGRKLETLVKDYREWGIHQMNYDVSELGPGQYYIILDTPRGTERSVLSVIR